MSCLGLQSLFLHSSSPLPPSLFRQVRTFPLTLIKRLVTFASQVEFPLRQNALSWVKRKLGEKSKLKQKWRIFITEIFSFKVFASRLPMHLQSVQCISRARSALSSNCVIRCTILLHVSPKKDCVYLRWGRASSGPTKSRRWFPTHIFPSNVSSCICSWNNSKSTWKGEAFLEKISPELKNRLTLNQNDGCLFWNHCHWMQNLLCYGFSYTFLINYSISLPIHTLAVVQGSIVGLFW